MKRNLHVPLSEPVHERPWAETIRSGRPATSFAREAIEAWIEERERHVTHDAIADYRPVVDALGLGDELVGRTHLCDYPSEVTEVPVVTVDDPELPARRLDRALLARLEPDLVLTDGSEDEPVVDYGEVSAVVGGMARETYQP